MLIAIFDPDPADAKKSKYMIQLCCTWEDSLDDDELPFSIKKGNADLTKIVQLFLTGRNIQTGLQNSNTMMMILNLIQKLNLKKIKEKVGKGVTYFDHNGYIKFLQISISKKSYDVTLDSKTLEHIIKPEIGHVIGFGHANFKNTLMSSKVNEIITEIYGCELDSVKFANHWKFSNEDNLPYPLEDDRHKCKKKEITQDNAQLGQTIHIFFWLIKMLTKYANLVYSILKLVLHESI